MKKSINISSLSVVASAIVLSVMFTGCGDTDPANEGNHLPDVNIVQNNKTINVGTKVDLTSTALDVDGDALTYEWKFVSKPVGSSATLTTTTTKKASFTADKAGVYVVQFVAKDIVDAIGKDTVTITAKEVGNISNTCTSYTEISGQITTDTTYDGCYKVVSNISVGNNALLTIKQGSTLVFQDSTELFISSDGALEAVGTIAEPILFTGEQKTAGYWKGLRFNHSNNVKNELDYVTVEYGGGNGYGNILLDSSSTPSRLKLSNSLLRHSSTHGFYFDDDSIISNFKNITSTKNTLTAGVLSANTLAALDSNSKFTGNLGDDYITLMSSHVTNNITWKALSVPVYVKGSVTIYKDLSIDANSTFIFNSQTEFFVNSKGSLVAKGTKSEPIIFTGEQKTAGYWKGLRFNYSNNAKNELDYVTVEYGGGNSYGNILLDSASTTPSRLKLSNSLLRHSLTHGFYFDDDSIISNFKNITSTKNTLTAGVLSANTLAALDSNSKFTGNLGDDYITLMRSYVTNNITWEALSVPVYVKGSVTIYKDLSIDANSTFIFNSQTEFFVNSKGSLVAKGTKSEPIIFTGEQKTAGYWKGLRFNYSNNAKNELDYVTVEYGGGNSYGNILLDSASTTPSRLKLSNSILSNSFKYGIWLDRYSITNNDIATSNTFTNNTSGSIGTD